MGCKPDVSYGSSDSKPRPFDDSDPSLTIKLEPLMPNLNGLAVSITGFINTPTNRYFLESLQICDAVTWKVDPISP